MFFRLKRFVVFLKIITCLLISRTSVFVYTIVLHVVWKDFLVLKVFLQCDAASHDSCELDKVHGVRTGVGCEVFLD